MARAAKQLRMQRKTGISDSVLPPALLSTQDFPLLTLKVRKQPLLKSPCKHFPLVPLPLGIILVLAQADAFRDALCHTPEAPRQLALLRGYVPAPVPRRMMAMGAHRACSPLCVPSASSCFPHFPTMPSFPPDTNEGAEAIQLCDVLPFI